ncbi:hypothetical protein [Burkholderia territorii]|uniref:hypothetical protein n=1 Tax=Burkholderia territorii TaxID=1503055 RepID=UPI0012D87ECD|nr:hypothetical protein [Burkholderia territorii]
MKSMFPVCQGSALSFHHFDRQAVQTLLGVDSHHRRPASSSRFRRDGCVVSGHAGDANEVVNLLVAASDTRIPHPDAVDASGLNELHANAF